MIAYKGFSIVFVILLAFVAITIAEQCGLRAPYDGLLTEFLGALSVAVITWAIVHVPQKKQHLKAALNTHEQIRRIWWENGPRLSNQWYSKLESKVELQKERKLGFVEAGFEDLYEAYLTKLDGLLEKQKYIQQIPPERKLRRSKWYRDPFNEANDPLTKIAKKILFFEAGRMKRYRLENATENDNETDPTFSVLSSIDHGRSMVISLNNSTGD